MAYPHGMWPLGFSRSDAVMWAAAVAVGAAVTLIGWATGARLGAAIAVAAIAMVIVVVLALLRDARGTSFRDAP